MKKKRLTKEKFMVYFIAFIMITSVFGVMFYGFGNAGGVVKYGDLKFTKSEKDNLWHLRTKTHEFSFNYLPQEVETLNISESTITNMQNSLEIDTTSDPESLFAESISFAEFSLAQNLPNKFIRIGFITNTTYDTPIITCNGATSTVPIIYFKQSNQTNIIEEGNCLIAESRDDFGFLRIKDRVLYGILNII